MHTSRWSSQGVSRNERPCHLASILDSGRVEPDEAQPEGRAHDPASYPW